MAESLMFIYKQVTQSSLGSNTFVKEKKGREKMMDECINIWNFV